MPSRAPFSVNIPALALILLLLSCYPLSIVLPPSWAWENGAIEDGDVIVLGVGLAWAFVTWMRAQPVSVALLARCVLPIWIILIGREMSWGAVLFAPDHMTAEGPVFTSHHLWYRPFVTPVLCALFAWSAWSAWRCRLDKQLYSVLERGRFPWLPMLTVLAAAVGSSCAESHLPYCLATLRNQRFEELTELAGYIALVVVQARVLGECRAAAPHGTAAAASSPAAT
ncbi:hypothetical protein ACFFTM_15160 [Pseudoduganella plicata]|nr:hypothetical protein [Pseudoduganella plicata]QBQ34762.1 hypothetical protein E1742_00090 [Pseudoduganella plicata]